MQLFVLNVADKFIIVSYAPGTHPGLLFQSGHHDDGTGSLLPNHPPEVTQSLRQRALRGNVGILFTVAVNVVGIDVVATWNTYRETRIHWWPTCASICANCMLSLNIHTSVTIMKC